MPSSTRSAVRALEAIDAAHVSAPALPTSPAPVLAGAPRTVASAPIPGRPLLRRHRGGTYSATVSEIRFEDGTGAYTDLIRLSPDVDAYSLDFTGAAPSGLATYTDAPWHGHAAASPVSRRAEVSWILTHSYPFVGLAHLTEELRAAGHHTGPGTLKSPEAIAATQAALWHVANGVGLDTQRLDVPERGEARMGCARWRSAARSGAPPGRLGP